MGETPRATGVALTLGWRSEDRKSLALKRDSEQVEVENELARRSEERELAQRRSKRLRSRQTTTRRERTRSQPVNCLRQQASPPSEKRRA